MEWIQRLLESGTTPIVTAFLLGLLTAISPCPLATNIAAVGFIGKDIDDKHRVFCNGLLYTAGRILTYAGIGLAFIPLLREGGEHLRPAKNHRQIRRCDRRSGTYSDRAVHAFRPQVEPAEIRIFGPLREDRPSRKLGCIAVRYSLFAGILPLERGFLLRNVDPDGGSRTGRLVSACRICYCDRYAGGHRSLDTGLRRGRSGHLLRTNADNPKVARTHRRDAVYRCGYLLLDNIFFIKKSFVNAI